MKNCIFTEFCPHGILDTAGQTTSKLPNGQMAELEENNITKPGLLHSSDIHVDKREWGQTVLFLALGIFTNRAPTLIQHSSDEKKTNYIQRSWCPLFIEMFYFRKELRTKVTARFLSDLFFKNNYQLNGYILCGIVVSNIIKDRIRSR